jgi:transcriptional regulator with XRE-family HTH domain
MAIEENVEIGKRLRSFGEGKYMFVHGWQKQFAHELETSAQTLSLYLRGDRIPGNKVQTRLRRLGCDIEWLMTGKLVSVRFDVTEHVHADGPISDKLRGNLIRYAEWVINNEDEDPAYIGYMAQLYICGGTTNGARKNLTEVGNGEVRL